MAVVRVGAIKRELRQRILEELRANRIGGGHSVGHGKQIVLIHTWEHIPTDPFDELII